MNARKTITLWLVVVFTQLSLQGQVQLIEGFIVDAESKEGLPFATVGFAGSSIGTISNEAGQFEIQVPEQFRDKNLQVSYMGYHSKLISISSADFSQAIELEPSVLTLEELVIRPLSPEDYIKRVLRNMDQVISQKPVQSQSYYREKFLENGAYLALSEGIWKAYHTAFGDTSKNQYQLMLFETAENPSELQFMKDSRDKKNEKRRRKAEKKGEDYEPSEGLINATFGGPDEILEMDMTNDLDEFLDSAYFKKFRYSFGTPVSFRDRQLLVIDFESKGKVDRLRSRGKIYIDTKTDAFASIEYDAEAVIPIAIEPILFAFGLSIKNPIIKKQLRYQLIDDSWYPEYFYISVDLEMTKRHIFSANEKSNFYIEQLLAVNRLNPESPKEIAKEYRYKSDEKPEEQVYNTENLKWSDFSRLVEKR